MEVAKILHMNGGIGDTSYAKNSKLQQKVILMTKPILEEAISALYRSLSPETICIAELEFHEDLRRQNMGDDGYLILIALLRELLVHSIIDFSLPRVCTLFTPLTVSTGFPKYLLG
ncbi:uncharacterized protein [Nicotiana tomentosiformis]|uniref:uncharacterized protein n=1 Tax=Nicotiana tomentosiformis TaxID=4098 RepID=UPI00388C5DBD